MLHVSHVRGEKEKEAIIICEIEELSHKNSIQRIFSENIKRFVCFVIVELILPSVNNSFSWMSASVSQITSHRLA